MTLTGLGGTATIDTAGNSVTLSGSLSGPGGLTKISGGTLTLTTANAFSGSTMIGGGVLRARQHVGLAKQHSEHQRQRDREFRLADGGRSWRPSRREPSSLANASSAAVALSVGGNGASTQFPRPTGPGGLAKIGAGALLFGQQRLRRRHGRQRRHAPGRRRGGFARLRHAGNNYRRRRRHVGRRRKRRRLDSRGRRFAVDANGGGFAAGSIFGVDTSGGSLSCNSNIAGSMGLAKLGGNARTPTASNTFSGPTTIGGGTLQIGNGGSIDNTSAITVGPAGALYVSALNAMPFTVAGGKTITVNGALVGNLAVANGSVLAGTGVLTGGGAATVNGGVNPPPARSP